MASGDSIYFHCPHCRGRLTAISSAAGSSEACPVCAGTVVIPDRGDAMSPQALRRLWWMGLAFQILLLVGLVGLWQKGVTEKPSLMEGEVSSPAPDRGGHLVDQQPGETADPVAPRAERTDDLVAQNRSLRAERRTLQSQYDSLSQWILENVRGKFPVPDRLVGTMRIPPMGDDYQVNGDLVELLHLDDQEVNLVNDALQFTRASMTDIEQQRIQIEEMNERRAVLRVPSYPAEGETMKEDLYLALEATLGPARMDRMIDVSEEELSRQFNHFGQGERALAFEVIEPADASIPPYLLIRDTWVLSEGESVRKSEITETAVLTVPEPYAPFVPWLPETFSPYTSP